MGAAWAMQARAIASATLEVEMNFILLVDELLESQVRDQET